VKNTKVVMIGHTLHSSWFGGEPRVARLILRALRGHGCDVRVIALPPHVIKWRIRSSALGTDIVSNLYTRLLQRIKPDVVVLWYDATLDTAIQLVELAKSLDYKLVYSVHFHHLWCPDGRFLCFYEKELTCDKCVKVRAFKIIDYSSLYIKRFWRKHVKLREVLKRYVEYYKFIVPSFFMAKLVHKILQVPWKNISVVYNGIDTDKFKPVKDKADKPTMLFVGANHNFVECPG